MTEWEGAPVPAAARQGMQVRILSGGVYLEEIEHRGFRSILKEETGGRISLRAAWSYYILYRRF